MTNEIAQDVTGSCTFLNMTGDITIVWDAQNRDRIIEIVRKKMAEGYTFFTTKRFLFDLLSTRTRVTKKNIEGIEELVITDAQFEKMVADMDDPDVAELVRGNKASLAKRKGKKEMTAMRRAKTPEEVVDCDSLAIRPIHGG